MAQKVMIVLLEAISLSVAFTVKARKPEYYKRAGDKKNKTSSHGHEH